MKYHNFLSKKFNNILNTDTNKMKVAYKTYNNLSKTIN